MEIQQIITELGEVLLSAKHFWKKKPEVDGVLFWNLTNHKKETF